MCKMGTETQLLVKITARRSHTGEAYWREMPIDSCIAPIVAALQNAGIDMDGSCCGHGVHEGSIILADGRWLLVLDPESVEMYRQMQTPVTKLIADQMTGRS
jgi:hypothetical protein